MGQPSMLVRLALAREMIGRANSVLDSLENGATATAAASGKVFLSNTAAELTEVA